LFYPFASQPEWELASFLLKSDLSRVAIDQFLKLQLVCMPMLHAIYRSIGLTYKFFRSKILGCHSKRLKTLSIAQKYCQLSSLIYLSLTPNKIRHKFLIKFPILNKASTGYQNKLILKVLPRMILSSITVTHCFVSNISSKAHLSRTTFLFHHSNSMKVQQRQ